MKVEQASIDSIIPYERNNRIHSEQQIDRIAKSITDFGFNQPIVVDETNTIIVGHGRLLAARKLGLSQAPILRVVGLSRSQKKAYRILDNKLQNDSTWDFDNLGIELGELKELGFDLISWGLNELETPNFEPASEEDQGKLDSASPVTCPECGHEFIPK